ncbi:MAG: four helix bundle protein [Clostridia bacterium]|nr:four helix bundle protein [Clostridia bacterium]
MADQVPCAAADQIEKELDGQYCLKKVEEMIALAYDIIPHWPPVFRYSRGERIFNLLFEMQELCVAGHLKYFKKTTLQDLDIKNHQLRLAVRGARRKAYTDKGNNRKHLLTPGAYEQWAKLSLETGCLIGGWMESVKDKKKAEQE